MLRAWEHVISFVLFVVFPWTAARRMRSLALHPPGAFSVQRFIYPRIVGGQWAVTLALLLGLWKLGISHERLGLVLPALPALAWTAMALLPACVVWELRLRRAVREPAHRLRLLQRFERARAIVPTDRSMMRWWVAVSLTAGVCEETIYRGYLGAYLAPWMPPWTAALVGSALFGFAHAYQGPSGMLRTGAVGLVLWGTYLATGSILPAMALHAAIDVRSGLALADARQAEERAAAERAAARPAAEADAEPAAEPAAP